MTLSEAQVWLLIAALAVMAATTSESCMPSTNATLAAWTRPAPASPSGPPTAIAPPTELRATSLTPSGSPTSAGLIALV